MGYLPPESLPFLNQVLSHTLIFKKEEIKSFMAGIELISRIDFGDSALFSTMLNRRRVQLATLTSIGCPIPRGKLY
jgi:hypothetical protein